MTKPETRNQKPEGSAQRPFLVSGFWFLVLLLALPLSANDIQVDKHTLSIDDSVTITVTLTDNFASIDNVQMPLQNLVLDGTPSVSSEFAWINGQSSRRKVLRYSAHPAGPGPALIGPIVLHGGGGQVDTLAPVSIQVLPDRSAGSNDPVKILHELLATGRDPFFVVAEADKTSVFAGEQVIVNWTIYNATNVQQQGIAEVPKLADFWVEELEPRGEIGQRVVVGGVSMLKILIRRVALFPLHSGTLTVDPLSVEAEILKSSDTGNPFGGLFEGSVADIRRRSAPLTIEARPIPPGPPVAAVGNVSMQCQTPVQKNGGPVSIDVVMRGPANLRGAPPPAFANPLDGSIQIAEKGVSVERHEEALMTRRWRFLIFPARSGMFVVPPLTTLILTPDGARRELRCEQRSLIVEAADETAAQPHAPPTAAGARVEAARRSLPLIGIAAALLVLLALVWPRLVRARTIRRHTRALVRETLAETRIAVDEWLSARGVDPAALLRETSERGDAWRALRSLLDGAERDRLVAEPAEIRARVRDVVAAMD
ncbi:MAG TPA: BatD family protein [Thermoanaerobaculia bacterium]|nr:BatD family protein [Thermoanaerobaculia bacterium]